MRNDNCYEESFVAFMDTLGFSDKIKESENNECVVEEIVKSLSVFSKFPSGESQKNSSNDCDRKQIDVRISWFSDSIIFVMRKDKETISDFLYMVRFLQDELWRNKTCLRGAITCGKMYWRKGGNSKITFGPALIKAINLESKIAIYPRIIVSNSLYDYIKEREIDAFPFASSEENNKQLSDYIIEDNDGVRFLDLLNPEIKRSDIEKITPINKNSFSISRYQQADNNHEQVMQNVEKLIRLNLEDQQDKGNDSVKQKYKWLHCYRERKRR
ncbi:hypothetical protein [Sedimentisphaera salicampi]|uniref:Uncharacterized protein n=1 Tax=Sedimentisphaera salicampi TaxID=1941349 RepID=A0A1W6LMU2_9BACT|nr:hypothetical protein [Sedimentisphaera salicampi]ARN57120.1 hypothetical protein STSP1_01515 [Sedimentisphaera salicampi]